MRVLVVDDEPNIIQLMLKTLERQGYQVETAGDGAEALVKIRANAPDILITDDFMPLMNGRELIDTLRDDPGFARLPIIAMGYVPALASERDSFIPNTRADMYLGKPFLTKQLVVFVNRLAEAIQSGELESYRVRYKPH